VVQEESDYAVGTAHRGPYCSAAVSVDTAHTSGSFCRSVRPFWCTGGADPAHWILPTVPQNPVFNP